MVCIIIAKPKNQNLPYVYLENSAETNPDGMGATWIGEKGNVVVYRSMENFEQFINKIEKRCPKWKDKDIIFHFRILTSGKKNIDNCHPFIINEQLSMAHNGTIRSYVKADSEYSDTYHFNEHLLKTLPKNFIVNNGIINLINEKIGNNKLAFMYSGRKTNNIIIIGEERGFFHNGVWYSNKSYESSMKKPVGNFKELQCDKCYVCNTKIINKIEIHYGVCFKCQGFDI